MASYCLYVLFTFLNEATGGERQMVGAVLFLSVVAACSARRLLPVPLTGLTVALLFSALLPMVALLSGLTAGNEGAPAYTIKYFSLLFVLLAASSLRLPPLYRTPERWWGLVAILSILLIGLARGSGEDRVEGSFANPNNYALVALSLLFFVDRVRDARWFIIGLYALVLALVILSGTTGALMGYMAGLAVALLCTRFARLTCAALAGAALLGALLLATLHTIDPAALAEMRIVGPLWSKVYIAQQHYADIAAGSDLNFWELGTEYGNVEYTSSIWRLAHWHDLLWKFRRSGVLSRLLGHGIGSSPVFLGKLPHNDYLRLLFEVGVLGLLANLAAWLILFRRAEPSARGPAAMMAAYAITENNLDNFLVMSLFALFLVSARRAIVPPPIPAPPGRVFS
ncbi:MAG TPA: hypothetical protein P5567_07840 [Kiritimatiellia bacterium]|nr:hypothetical protein [Kiritimatiellia bacterium]HRZ12350.1 hypothetical protein [Kiritimatiellia bacterium]HSA17892.1 hypothetical protein [Kiritimatiellia bacterium]